MTECSECGSGNVEFKGWDNWGNELYSCRECGHVWVEFKEGEE